MFYVHDPGILFIHIPKNAGTSISASLHNAYGSEGSRVGDYRVVSPKKGPARRRKKHITASMARSALPGDDWERAFKFAVVRNPWDRLVSMWRYGVMQCRKKGGVRVLQQLDLDPGEVTKVERQILESDFKWWLMEFARKYRWYPANQWQGQPPLVGATPPAQLEWLTEGTKIIVNKIYRFEELKTLERDLHCKLPHLNATEQEPYAPHYDVKTRDWVTEAFADDINRFGYTF